MKELELPINAVHTALAGYVEGKKLKRVRTELVDQVLRVLIKDPDVIQLMLRKVRTLSHLPNYSMGPAPTDRGMQRLKVTNKLSFNQKFLQAVENGNLTEIAREVVLTYFTTYLGRRLIVLPEALEYGIRRMFSRMANQNSFIVLNIVTAFDEGVFRQDKDGIIFKDYVFEMCGLDAFRYLFKPAEYSEIFLDHNC